METHAVIRKWNIIFLIYAELEDITTNFNGRDGYEADVKADLDQLLKIILEIDTHDSFNLLTIENKVQIKDEIIQSDVTYISRLIFDPCKGNNTLLQLQQLEDRDFAQKSDSIKKVFRYIDRYYPAEKNMLITWDHGSAFGIFKKKLKDPPRSEDEEVSPARGGAGMADDLPIQAKEDLLSVNTKVPESPCYKVLAQKKLDENNTILVVKNRRFLRPDTFFTEKMRSGTFEEAQTIDFALLSNDKLAEAISMGFKGKQVDVLLMFNCFMQNVHTCFSLCKNVSHLVAPEGSICAPGYDYKAIARSIKESQGNIDGKQLARLAVNTFRKNYIFWKRAAALKAIGVFAFSLQDYEQQMIAPLKDWIQSMEEMIRTFTELPGEMRAARAHDYEFGIVQDMDYQFIDLNNYMLDLVKRSDKPALKKPYSAGIRALKKSLKVASTAIRTASTIGRGFYADGRGTSQTIDKQRPTGISIYFPQEAQQPPGAIEQLFIIPGAPFVTSLIEVLKWREFIDVVYPPST
jgi:hypothetical protein